MKVFNAVCFAVLMDHHKQGIEGAHPDYIQEKLAVFENCSEYSAYSLLDHVNKSRVHMWCTNWNIPIPS